MAVWIFHDINLQLNFNSTWLVANNLESVGHSYHLRSSHPLCCESHSVATAHHRKMSVFLGLGLHLSEFAHLHSASFVGHNDSEMYSCCFVYQ